MYTDDVHREINIIANMRIGELITDVALDLGIVDKSTEEALLIAQAAARTVVVIEDCQQAKPITDDIFKFVGSEGDPAALQEAQAVWQLANYLKHNELSVPLGVFYASAYKSFGVASRKVKDSEYNNTAENFASLQTYCSDQVNKLNTTSVDEYSAELYQCATGAMTTSNGVEKEKLKKICLITQVHEGEQKSAVS